MLAANRSLVGTLITKGDITRNIAIKRMSDQQQRKQEFITADKKLKSFVLLCVLKTCMHSFIHWQVATEFQTLFQFGVHPGENLLIPEFIVFYSSISSLFWDQFGMASLLEFLAMLWPCTSHLNPYENQTMEVSVHPPPTPTPQ